MNKKIIRAVAAGGALINVIGNGALVSAYSEATMYPENANTGITVTMVDERREQVSLYFKEPFNPTAVFRGVKLFNGEMHDNGLHAVNFTEAPWTTEYLATSMYDEDFEDLETGEERTFATVDLADNDAKTMGIAYMYWNNIEMQSLFNIRARMNYSRCAKSEIYQTTEEAICRAEKNEAGELYYQPYVGWERLSLPGEPEEEREVLVYKDREWTSVTINREEKNGENESGNTGGDSEGGEGEDATGVENSDAGASDGASTDADAGAGVSDGADAGAGLGGGEASVAEPEIKYIEIEKIVEVPVEKKVIEKVEVEVPVEKIVTEKVEVQVPVEKTVVDTREVVREVPVLANFVTGVTNSDGVVEAADGEGMVETDSDEGDALDEDVAEGDALDEDEEPTIATEQTEEIEVPELGKEFQKEENPAIGIVALIAGIASAIAIFMLAMLSRKRKQEDKE